jgi:putative membrane protein
MTSLLQRALRVFICVSIVTAGAVSGAEDPRNVPDTTPPPLGTASFVPPANIDEQPLTPESFVTRAALINMAETEIGGLAQSRSGTAAVKSFGAQLVKDHRAALAKLKTIAAQAKIALPGELDPEHQSLRDELAALEGPAFDAKFATAMASGHEKAIRLFKAAAGSAKLTPALRSYAESMLPTLEQHAQLAHQLASSR